MNRRTEVLERLLKLVRLYHGNDDQEALRVEFDAALPEIPEEPLHLQREREAEATIEGAGMIGTSVDLVLRLPLAPCPIRFGDKVRVSWPRPTTDKEP